MQTFRIVHALLWSGVLFALACGGASKQSELEPAPGAFSAARAWTHFERLSELSSESADGLERTRGYLVDQLSALGLATRRDRVSGAGDASRVHLHAVVPGRVSSDSILLVASYGPRDAASVGVDPEAGTAGAALVLELGRVLLEDPVEYSVGLVFLDRESDDASGDSEEPAEWGRFALAASDDASRPVRLVVVFDRVAGRNLEVARDLYSVRIFREVFFTNAGALGHGAMFPPNGPLSAPQGNPRDFRVVGDPPVVRISASPRETTADPCCAPESLEGVGTVSLASLRSIAAKLARLARFHRAPYAMEFSDEPSWVVKRIPDPVEGQKTAE